MCLTGRGPDQEAKIISELDKLGNYLITNHMRNEVLAAIRAKTYTERRQFDSDNQWLSVKNCLVNLYTGETKPHDPTFLTLVQLPITYDKNVDCKNWKQFLADVLPNEDDRNTMLDFMAYCLLRDYPFHKALMQIGSGRNGKGTLNRAFSEFLGNENIANVGLQELDTHRFKLAELYGKLANIGPDLKVKLLEETGNFKAVTGNDWITAERKHGHPFKFKNYAKIIQQTNKIPDTLDDTDAFFSRWLIVVFPKQFLAEDGTADPCIDKKLITPEEKSGLFNLLLERLPNIIKNGIASSAKTIEATYQKYMLSADPIRLFIEQCLEQANDDTPKIEVYNAYEKFVESRGMAAERQEVFGRRMKAHGYRDGRTTIGRSAVYIWKDVRLKTPDAEPEKEQNLF